jgi:hypothetical protein
MKLLGKSVPKTKVIERRSRPNHAMHRIGHKAGLPVMAALHEKGYSIMKKKRIGVVSRNSYFKAYCHFCGATVSQISDRTQEKVTAIYDCTKCRVNYYD